MVFEGTGRAFREESDVGRPELVEGEALIEISLATICGSDLHTHAGRRSALLPASLGHEGVGTVTELGPGLHPDLLGQRVTWTLAASCGTCPACSDWQLPQKCTDLFKYGHAAATDGHGLNGCFASHVVLRRGTTILPLPQHVSDTMAAPANCALATMVAVVETLSDAHQHVLIQGAGLLGLYGAALLNEAGKQVVMVDPDPTRRELAQAFGADRVFASSDGLGAESVDAVLEVAGTPKVIAEGIRVLRPGGQYVLAGLVHPESALDLTGDCVIRKCLTLRGIHNYAPQHLKSGIGFLETQYDAYPWDRLVSEPIPLTNLDEAFELALSRRWPRVAVCPST